MTEGDRPPERRQVSLHSVVATVIAALVVWFALANSQRVKVHYLVGTSNSRLIWVIVVSALLGAVVDRLLIYRRRRREKRGD